MGKNTEYLTKQSQRLSLSFIRPLNSIRAISVYLMWGVWCEEKFMAVYYLQWFISWELILKSKLGVRTEHHRWNKYTYRLEITYRIKSFQVSNTGRLWMLKIPAVVPIWGSWCISLDKCTQRCWIELPNIPHSHSRTL